LKEAIETWREIIIRSEHPQEYNGVSGLLKSFSTSKKRIEADRIKQGFTVDILPKGSDFMSKVDLVFSW
jgi:hypothetical protein